MPVRRAAVTFINGVLDEVVEALTAEKRIRKTGSRIAGTVSAVKNGTHIASVLMRKPIVVEKQFLIIGLLCFACSCGTGGEKVVPDKAGATVIALTDSVGTDTVEFWGGFTPEKLSAGICRCVTGAMVRSIVLSAATNCGCTTVDFEREPVQPRRGGGIRFRIRQRRLLRIPARTRGPAYHAVQTAFYAGRVHRGSRMIFRINKAEFVPG